MKTTQRNALTVTGKLSGQPMIGVLGAIREPERFAKLVLVGPSPCSSTTRDTPADSAPAPEETVAAIRANL
jgi:hypothetical protein